MRGDFLISMGALAESKCRELSLTVTGSSHVSQSRIKLLQAPLSDSYLRAIRLSTHT